MDPNSYSAIDDIPEAQRDVPVPGNRGTGWRGMRRWLVWFLLGLLSAIAGLVVSWLTYQGAETATPLPIQPMVSLSSADTPPNALVSATAARKSLLGHFAYEEAPAAELMALTVDPSIRLRPAAANAFDAMVAAAEAEGILLQPLSGFRSLEDQQYLFFNIKAERGQTTTTRAEVSAPPGYSEHHTGYAIDIGAAAAPETHLEVAFEETPAFQWLAANAARYNFELSFPVGNPQGVQYEPWHWRFVGDSDSLETFYQNR